MPKKENLQFEKMDVPQYGALASGCAACASCAVCGLCSWCTITHAAATLVATTIGVAGVVEMG